MTEGNKGCLADLLGGILSLVGLFLVFYVGIMLFGSFIKEWDETDILQAKSAKAFTRLEMYWQFGEQGILEQRMGKNLRIYISRKNLAKFPYPERDKPIKEVGCAWCDSIEKWYFPKVYFYDVDTGNKLGSYSCVFKYVTINKQ